MDKVKRFREIVNQMADLYEKKNANYGNSFGELYEKLGPTSGLIPLHNKLDRLTNLITGGKNDFESIEDSLKDLACYAVMNLIEKEYQDSKLKSENTSYDKNNCATCLCKEYFHDCSGCSNAVMTYHGEVVSDVSQILKNSYCDFCDTKNCSTCPYQKQGE